MMILDPKKAITTIMAKRRSNMGEPMGQASMKNEDVKDTDGEQDPRHMAAQDVMMALHEKSAHRFMEAMGNFMDMHKMHSDSIDNSDKGMA